MSKGYKKEYVDKVKSKFNDIQRNSKLSDKSIAKPRNDKHGKICNTN